MLQILAVILIVLVDQAVKYIVRTGFQVGETHRFIEGVLSFSYVRNTGAAWSLLNQHTWILTVLSVVLSIVIAVLLFKKVFNHPLATWSLTAVLGGAVGNLIDRAFLGYVVDMFSVEFVDFPVFNVADIFITLGGIGIVVYLLFVYKEKKSNDGE